MHAASHHQKIVLDNLAVNQVICITAHVYALEVA